MIIQFHRIFRKQFSRLPRRQQAAVDKALRLFKQNPFDPALSNHELKGKMKKRRSIVAGFDLRIIFEEHDHYVVVILLQVGTHQEVYGNP